ncbi:hypothetical protein EG329_003513 [Mollisiaceae sp. DMI_Dod_QoI]|nr:hypothetical protein EG329_003513 [Helotiales sp. DMI_Dod_QoI]
MKYSIAALVWASVAYSQTIQSEMALLPQCGLTCLTNASTSAGCSITDYACICGTKKNTITQSATPCILGTCSTSDALKVQSISQEICTLEAASASGSASSTASSSIAKSSSSSTVTSTASSKASSTASNSNSASKPSSSATSTAAGSSSASAPASTTGNAGSRLESVGVMSVVAMLAAFAL